MLNAETVDREATAPASHEAVRCNELGKHFYAAGDRVSATGAFARAAQAGFVSGYYNLALSLAQQGRIDLASEAYRLAVSIDPDYRRWQDLRIAPGYVQIESVRACNAACIMCPLETSPTPNQAMADAVFERIVEQVTALRPIPGVAIHGLSEPLMDKKLLRRIKHLKAKGVGTVSIVSNASLMTEETAAGLIDAGIADISFSIESIDAPTYEAIRIGLKLDDVVRGIISFLTARNRSGRAVPVRLLFTYSERNRQQYESFRAFWSRHLRPGLDTISLLPIHSFGKFDLYNSDNHGACYQIFTDMHIRASGTASLCCIDVEADYKVGHIAQASILEIYNSDQIRLDRHRHLLGDRHAMKLCADCDQPECSQRVIADDLKAAPPRLDGSAKFFIPA